MKDCCKEVLDALQIMQTAIDSALVPKEDKDQKDWRIAFDEWVNSTKSATYDPPQIVCDSYEQKGVFAPVERPTPKPILVISIGLESHLIDGDGNDNKDPRRSLKEHHDHFRAALNDEYNVITKWNADNCNDVTFEIL